MKQGRGFWFCCGICLICALLIKPVQDRIEKHLGNTGPDPDLLYFSSASAVKKMALSYDALLADFYWMRTIQYYGRREEADKRLVRYKNLSTLLDITTTLDPDLLDAYRSGSSFLSEAEPIGAGRPDEAIQLLDKGIRAHPDKWELMYDKGFIYFWYLKNFRAAGDVWIETSKIVGAPHWMPSLAAMSLSKGGSIELAKALWQQQYKNSAREKVKDNARNHLVSIQVAEELWSLEFLIESYRTRTGSFPLNLQQLVREQNRRYSITDPLGTPYAYNPATGAVRLSPESKVVYLPVPDSYRDQFRSRLAVDGR
jgi:hypothetical protein